MAWPSIARTKQASRVFGRALNIERPRWTQRCRTSLTQSRPTVSDRPTAPARDTTRLEQRTRELAAYLEQWAYDERLFSTYVGGISVATHFRVSGREAVEIADEVAALLAQRDARETALRALVVKWRAGGDRPHPGGPELPP